MDVTAMDEFVLGTGDAQMEMIVVRSAVPGLKQDVLGFPNELHVFTSGASMLDEKGLEPAGKKDPLDVGLGRGDEGFDKLPISFDIKTNEGAGGGLGEAVGSK